MGVPSEKYDAALGHIIEEAEYALEQVEWTFTAAEQEDHVAALLIGILETARVLKRERESAVSEEGTALNRVTVLGYEP